MNFDSYQMKARKILDLTPHIQPIESRQRQPQGNEYTARQFWDLRKSEIRTLKWRILNGFSPDTLCWAQLWDRLNPCYCCRCHGLFRWPELCPSTPPCWGFCGSPSWSSSCRRRCWHRPGGRCIWTCALGWSLIQAWRGRLWGVRETEGSGSSRLAGDRLRRTACGVELCRPGWGSFWRAWTEKYEQVFYHYHISGYYTV